MTHHAGSAAARALALATLAILVGACGGSGGDQAVPGSPSNPVAATGEAGSEVAPEVQQAGAEPEAGTADGAPPPGYENLVGDQSKTPAERFTPCNLVTKAQAEAIIGTPIREPVEAPQGPTCIYRSATGGSFVTLALQRADFEAVTSQLRRPRRLDVARRRAYCATSGLPTLYVSVSGGRVLTIAAPCATATRFAARAAPRLSS